MLRLIPVLLLVAVVAAACGGLPEPPTPAPTAPPASPLCTENVINGPELPLRFNDVETLARNCVGMSAGASTTVTFTRVVENIDNVTFFINCPAAEDEDPPEGCIREINDQEPNDGFAVTFTAPGDFDSLLITVIAYDADGAPLTLAGPAIVVIE